MADLSVLVPAETQYLRDPIYGAARFVQSAAQRNAGLYENPLHLQDGPPLADLNPRPVLVSAESLKIADGGVATQSGIAQLLGVLHITDTVTAALGDISITVPGELLHVQDAVTPFIVGGNLSVTVGAEALHCTDGLPSAQLVGASISANVTSESLKLADGGIATQRGIVQLLGVLHIQDTVTAAMAGPAGDLSITVGQEVLHLSETASDLYTGLTELVHVQDTATVLLDLAPVSLSELVHVQDTVTVSLGGNLSILVSSETLHVQDTAQSLLNPLQTSTPDELLHVQDVVTTTLDPLQASVSELLHCQDTPTVVLSGTGASVQESVKIADTISTILTPLLATGVSELLHVQDQALVGNDLFESTAQESLKLADTVSVSLDPLQSNPSELIHVSDTPIVQFGLTIVLNETLRVQDVIVTSLTPLNASGFDEAILVADSVVTIPTKLLIFYTVPSIDRVYLVPHVDRLVEV